MYLPGIFCYIGKSRVTPNQMRPTTLLTHLVLHVHAALFVHIIDFAFCFIIKQPINLLNIYVPERLFFN